MTLRPWYIAPAQRAEPHLNPCGVGDLPPTTLSLERLFFVASLLRAHRENGVFLRRGRTLSLTSKPMQMATNSFPLCKQLPRCIRLEWLSSAILSKKTDRVSRKIQRFALVKGRSNALRWLWVIEFFELIDEGGFVVIADMNIDVLLVLCEVLDLSRECTFDDTVE